ncbi:MAG: hypothetical protein AAF479_14025, partial [Pseudomonadota bacterium]
MPNFLHRSTAILFACLCLVLMPMQSGAVAVGPWSLAGPGDTTIVEIDDTTHFNYSINPSGLSTQTWTATAVVAESGVYQFDWTFSGLHSFFNVTAFLNTINPASTLVNAGPTNCCTPPSNGFSYSGTDAFAVTAGQTIGFAFGGSNSDSNDFLAGTLSISAVPLPPAFVLMLAALGLV